MRPLPSWLLLIQQLHGELAVEGDKRLNHVAAFAVGDADGGIEVKALCIDLVEGNVAKN